MNKQNTPKFYIDNVAINGIRLDDIQLENEPNEHYDTDDVFLDLSETVLKGTIKEDSITSLDIEIKYNEHKVLTFYVNGEPNGIIIYSKMNIVNGKPVYPFEFKIFHKKGHCVFLKYSPNKLTVSSIQKEEI